MKVIKQGQQRLFEQDAETAAVVSRMLMDLEKNGMDAVRQYSRRFDEWDPLELPPVAAPDRRGDRRTATNRRSATPSSARRTCVRSPKPSCARCCRSKWRHGRA